MRGVHADARQQRHARRGAERSTSTRGRGPVRGSTRVLTMPTVGAIEKLSGRRQGRSRRRSGPSCSAGRTSGRGTARRARRSRWRSPGTTRRGCGRRRPGGAEAGGRRAAAARRTRRAGQRCPRSRPIVTGLPQPSVTARERPNTSAQSPLVAVSAPGTSSGRAGAGTWCRRRVPAIAAGTAKATDTYRQ